MKLTVKIPAENKGYLPAQKVSPQLVTLKQFLKPVTMPMQRKRARDCQDRFHYRFLERYDLTEMSYVCLLSACILLLFGMQARNSINAREMVLAGIFSVLATTLSMEARKKRCTTRLPSGSKV